MKDLDLPVFDDNFPTDDEYSVQLGAGNADLNIYYASQYVQSEEIVNKQSGTECEYPFAHATVTGETVTGTIYHDGHKVQSFFPNGKKFAFTGFPFDGPKVVDARVDEASNVLVLVWNQKVKAGTTKVVVNYEYQ